MFKEQKSLWYLYILWETSTYVHSVTIFFLQEVKCSNFNTLQIHSYFLLLVELCLNGVGVSNTSIKRLTELKEQQLIHFSTSNLYVKDKLIKHTAVTMLKKFQKECYLNKMLEKNWIQCLSNLWIRISS